MNKLERRTYHWLILVSIVFVLLLGINAAFAEKSFSQSVDNISEASSYVYIYDQGNGTSYPDYNQKSIKFTDDNGVTSNTNLGRAGCGLYTYAHAIQWLTSSYNTESEAISLLDTLIRIDPTPANTLVPLDSYIKTLGVKEVSRPTTESAIVQHFENGGVVILHPYVKEGNNSGGHYALAIGAAYGNIDGNGNRLWIHVLDSSVGSTTKRINYSAYEFVSPHNLLPKTQPYYHGGDYWIPVEAYTNGFTRTSDMRAYLPTTPPSDDISTYLYGESSIYKATKATNVKSKPYAQSADHPNSETVISLKKDDKVTIDAAYQNQYQNKWYHIVAVNGNTSYKGYVYADDCTFVESTASAYIDQNSMNGARIKSGNGYEITGILNSTNAIQKIDAYVYQKDLIGPVKPVQEVSVDNIYSFNIGPSIINTGIKLANYTTPGTYIFRLDLHCKTNNQAVDITVSIDTEFEIYLENGGTVPPATTVDILQFQNVVYPQKLVSSSIGWALTDGILASNVELTSITSRIYRNSDGKTVSSCTKSISGKSYSIRNLDDYSGTDNGVRFSYIYTQGFGTGAFTWELTGKDSSGRSLTLSMPFEVISSGSTSTATAGKKYTASVTQITLSSTSTTLNVGETKTITATVSPSDAANKNVTWKSSNNSVATVSSGKITAVGAGNATITCTASDGSGVSASCSVTVWCSLDVNGRLDGGKVLGTCSDFGTFDVYINGILKAASVSDYVNRELPNGTTYEIKNVKSKSGYRYKGLASDVSHGGGLSGTIKNEEAYIVLDFVTTYPVTYNANGGTGAPSMQEKDKGTALKLRSGLPTREGYTFLGWATSASATTAQYQPGGSYTQDASVTLYAVWEKKTYYKLDVNARLDGGEVLENCKDFGIFDVYINAILKAKSVSEYVNCELPNDTDYEITNIITRWGYRCKGLALDVSYGGDTCGIITNSDVYIVLDFVTTYPVTYNANGGTGEPRAEVKDKGDKTFEISSVRPTRDKYTFLGWATSPDATEAQYQPGDSYTQDAPLTLYAVWERKPIYGLYVNARLDGGEVLDSCKDFGMFDVYINDSLSSEASIVYYNTGLPKGTTYEIRNIKAKSGYRYSGQNISGTIASADVNIILDFVTIYRISYDANGGSGAPSSQEKVKGTALTLSSARPTREDYTFLGWATSASATTAQYQPGGSYTQDASVTLYAIWEKKTVAYELDVNGRLDGGKVLGTCSDFGTFDVYINGILKDASVSDFVNRELPSGTTYEIRNIKATSGYRCKGLASDVSHGGGLSGTIENEDAYIVLDFITTYPVTYNANGGTGEPRADIKDKGDETFKISSVRPTRDGYTFLGWATSSTATTAQYQPGDSYTQDAPLTLYAVWEKNAARSGKCGDNATWTLTDDGILEISGTGEMYNYDNFGIDRTPWINSLNEDIMAHIKQLIVNEGITKLGRSTCEYAYNLESVSLPESLVSIGDYAFADCKTLEAITIPRGVQTIANKAFYNCKKLTIYCYVNSAALSYAKDHSIPFVILDPENATHVSELRLNKTSLDLERGENVQLVITIVPDDATYTDIYWSSSNPSVATVSDDGLVNAVGEGTAIITCTSDDPNGVSASCNVTVTLPHVHSPIMIRPTLATKAEDGLSIGFRCACGEVTQTQKIIESEGILSLPAALKRIDAEAFAGANMQQIIIPDGMTEIGARAFANCRKLLVVSMPDSVGSIADDAFDGCDTQYFCIVANDDSYAAQYAERNGLYHCNFIEAFDVIFDANGGECDIAYISAEVGKPLGELPVPAREGCSFDGWYTESGERVTADTVIQECADVHLLAKWRCTIAFDANGGSCATSTKTIDCGDAIGSLPSPARTYYTFNGWFTAASGGTKVEAGTTFAADTTLYAQWTRNTCTITFNANGGTCSTGNRKMNCGDAIGSLPTPTRTYYTFNGWFTAASGGTKVETGTTFAADTTLYAQWTRNTCTITFNANGGSCSTGNRKMNCGDAIGSLPTPARTYYTFNGWFTAASGGTKVTTGTTFAANTTLYAQWTSKGYGSWSGWSTTAYTASSTRQVETKTERVQTGTKTTYSYDRYLYYHPGNGYNMSSYASNWATSQGYKGNWQYITLEYALTPAGSTDGVAKYTGYYQDGNQYWWHQSVNNEAVYTNVTYYRYRDLIP